MLAVRIFNHTSSEKRLWNLEPLTEFWPEDLEEDGGVRTTYGDDDYMDLTCGELVQLVQVLEPHTIQWRIAMNAYTLKDQLGFTKMHENPRVISEDKPRRPYDTKGLTKLRTLLNNDE